MKTLEEIEAHRDFEYAKWYYEECWCIAEGCDNLAYGVIYYWCGDPFCCAPPAGFYCEECLVKIEG